MPLPFFRRPTLLEMLEIDGSQLQLFETHYSKASIHLTTKTIEQYHRSSFTPQDEHVECETKSWYQEVSKLKAKYDSLQRTQRHLLGEDVGPLNIKDLQNLEKQLEGGRSLYYNSGSFNKTHVSDASLTLSTTLVQGVICQYKFEKDVSEDVHVYTDDENKFKIEIPQEWQVGTGDGESSGFKSITAFYPTVASNSNVSVVITGLGPDFTRMESFGKVDEFAQTLV
ncbi:hypothetical protein JHK87_044400 [Glycine soja]|nr:hypothetical protein JHK87_044400 [Glycine soja]